LPEVKRYIALDTARKVGAEVLGGHGRGYRRFDDVHRRIDDLRTNMNARFAQVDARLLEVREDMREIRGMLQEALRVRAL
jgi:hypothetical protein